MARASKLYVMTSGLKSYLPGLGGYRGTGGSTSARYCYTVWLRHLQAMVETGAAGRLNAVVELGPGDSLGVGLAALLSGAAAVTALDVQAHNEPARDLRVFEELVQLFAARAPVPGNDEFPLVQPAAPPSPFPAAAVVAVAVSPPSPARLAEIRAAIPRRDGAAGQPLRYVCPWTPDAVAPGTVDLIVSQAVLQEMAHEPGEDVLDRAFAAMRAWLRPGGVMSHQVDLAAPIGRAWNDHWTAGDLAWRLMRGRRPVFFNRVPLSGYLALCARHGLEVLRATPVTEPVWRRRHEVARRFRALPDEDYRTSAVHLIARRPGARAAAGG